MIFYQSFFKLTYCQISCSVKFNAANKVFKDYHRAMKRLNISEIFLYGITSFLMNVRYIFLWSFFVTSVLLERFM